MKYCSPVPQNMRLNKQIGSFYLSEGWDSQKDTLQPMGSHTGRTRAALRGRRPSQIAPAGKESCITLTRIPKNVKIPNESQ